MSMEKIQYGRENLKRCFRLKRRKIRCMAIEAVKKDMESHQDHGSSDLWGCWIW